jgi:mRNA-degrading endonuclease RelE of RelBE toxin-antitoxin system
MKWSVDFTIEFLRMAKPLWKKYKSLMEDLDHFINSLAEDPFQGDILQPGIRKIRVAIKSKGGGKSKGARIITLTFAIDEDNGKVALLLIYDHNQADTVDRKMVRVVAKKLGYDVDKLQGSGKMK